MFNIDGDRLVIDGSLEHDECGALFDFLKEKLEYIESIELDLEGDTIPSSALIGLLFSAKKTKESLDIAILKDGWTLPNLGQIKITE